jgi:hypothetical protein
MGDGYWWSMKARYGMMEALVGVKNHRALRDTWLNASNCRVAVFIQSSG